MAQTRNNHFNPQAQLSPNQQDLLLAALASNNPNRKSSQFNPDGISATKQTPSDLQLQQPSFANYDSLNMNLSPDQFTSPGQLDGLNSFDVDESPFPDFLDDEGNFDFDTMEGGDMIGALPGDPGSGEGTGDLHEKRKSRDDDQNDVEIANKKKEGGEDKTAKKPGRKPLTSEPTTKRKAQNRAAQRAFRERKEKHLKDLETKVNELEKESESTNHENGLLRAQVTRLQTELREYRKRLSLGGLNRSPPLSGSFSNGVGMNGSANNFQFEFPRFGNLPGSQVFGNSIAKPGAVSPPANNVDSTPRSMSPRSHVNSVGTGSPNQHTTSRGNSLSGQTHVADNLNGVLGPSVSGGVGVTSPDYGFPTGGTEHRNSSDSSFGQSRVFQFNSASGSTTDSPSASSVSQYGGQNSSCGTSPESNHCSPPSADKPGAEVNGNPLDTISEGTVCHGNTEGEVTFCEKLNMACGNLRNPVPRSMSQSSQRSNGKPSPAAVPPSTAHPASSTLPTAVDPAITDASAPATDVANLNGLDWLSTQNGGQFDPMLFGDYRESQAAIVGTGEDFSNGFFNDAFPLADFGSPFNFGDAATGTTPAAAAKPNPMEAIERIQDGVDDDEVVPGEDTSRMLSCHKIWDKLQDRDDFKNGSFDIDGLCSELRAKARCSESGVVVDQKDVDAALTRLPPR